MSNGDDVCFWPKADIFQAIGCRLCNVAAGEKDMGQMHGQNRAFHRREAYERMMRRWSRVASEAFLAWLDLPKGLRRLDAGWQASERTLR
jgi:hypothetical protein